MQDNSNHKGGQIESRVPNALPALFPCQQNSESKYILEFKSQTSVDSSSLSSIGKEFYGGKDFFWWTGRGSTFPRLVSSTGRSLHTRQFFLPGPQPHPDWNCKD